MRVRFHAYVNAIGANVQTSAGKNGMTHHVESNVHEAAMNKSRGKDAVPLRWLSPDKVWIHAKILRRTRRTHGPVLGLYIHADSKHASLHICTVAFYHCVLVS